MLILAVTLLAAGSKTILAAMAVMILLSAIPAQAQVPGGAGGGHRRLGTLTFCQPPGGIALCHLSVRGEGRGCDVPSRSPMPTSFLENPATVFLGNGLAKQLTPGVPTNDERWFENSKFDIENGYWGVLAKLGVVGVVLFGLLFSALPRNPVSLAVGAILLILVQDQLPVLPPLMAATCWCGRCSSACSTSQRQHARRCPCLLPTHALLRQAGS
jgi:hypothetical protein